MPTFDSTKVSDNYPAISPANHNVMAVTGVYTVPATLALADVVQLVKLPPGCEPVDVILDTDDLDTHGTPLITLDVGIINSAGNAISAGTTMITASTVAQAGGVVRGSTKGMCGIASAALATRKVGVVVSAAGATPAAGDIRLTVFYRSK